MLFDTRPSALHILTSGEDDTTMNLFHTLNGPRVRKSRRSRLPRVFVPKHGCWTTEHEGVLEVELPGVAREDVDVVVQGSNLRVTGKRYREVEEEEKVVKKIKLNVEDAGEDKGRIVHDIKKHTETENERKEEISGEGTKTKESEGNRNDDVRVTDNIEEKRTSVKRHPSKVFKIVFKLHPKVDVEKITVKSHEDGLLRMRLPYKSNSMPRKIPVS